MALNVLVVDDSSVMRTMIIRSLRLSGLPIAEYHQAGNGRDGLGVLEKHKIDLALVDLNMPIMSGEEMLELIRKNPAQADLAIVVVSTEGSSTRIARIRGQRAEFVHKPFSPEMLRETILNLLGVQDADVIGEEAPQGSSTDF
jgi:two-component system chemotaxis response regulator CheY